MHHVLETKSGTPTSAKVGRSGAKLARWALAMPSGRIVPASNCGLSVE